MILLSTTEGASVKIKCTKSKAFKDAIMNTLASTKFKKK